MTDHPDFRQIARQAAEQFICDLNIVGIPRDLVHMSADAIVEALRPCLRAESQAGSGEGWQPISVEDREDAISLAIFVGRHQVPLDSESLKNCREYQEARELLLLNAPPVDPPAAAPEPERTEK